MVVEAVVEVVVEVGLCRLQHELHVSTRSGIGTTPAPTDRFRRNSTPPTGHVTHVAVPCIIHVHSFSHEETRARGKSRAQSLCGRGAETANMLIR